MTVPPAAAFGPVEGAERQAALAYLAHARTTALAGVAGGRASAAPRRIGIVGAGTMGGGIALAFADAGATVVVAEPDEAGRERATRTIAAHYDNRVARGKLDAAEAAERRGRIAVVPDVADVGVFDLAVEAVVEDLTVKQGVFARLAAGSAPGTPLATNTSALDVDAIAAASGRPADVVGLHFFSPAHATRLIEIVPGAATSAATLGTAAAVCGLLGRSGVLAANRDGFIGNRMLYALRREAEFVVEEGASPEAVDRILEAFGFAMGPFAVADLAGLDIGYRVRRRQYAEHPPAGRIPRIADALCEAGRLGQKSGAGWYAYAPGDRRPRPDPAVGALVVAIARAHGIVRREIADGEIAARCLHALVREGRAAVADGTARRPGDVDVVWVDGYGFPAARGGPLYWAERYGPFEADRPLR